MKMAREFSTAQGIALEDYIRIPDTNVLISKEEKFKDHLVWRSSHWALGREGLFMLTIPLFIKHYKNVKNAAKGETSLYDGDNNLISQAYAKKLRRKLFSDCETWLDAHFKLIDKKMHVVYNHRSKDGTIVIDSDIITETLDDETLLGPYKWPRYLSLSSWLDNPTNQGLPRKSTKKASFEDLTYSPPEHDRVAAFFASGITSGLLCTYEPDIGWYHNMPVFACTKISGDK